MTEGKPHLGLATTRELLEEIAARVHVSKTIDEALDLDYSTVGRIIDFAVWSCKIVGVPRYKLQEGADSPMRKAVEEAFIHLTGREPDHIFSGWGAKLSPGELEVVSDGSRS